MDYLENCLARLYKSPDDSSRILLHAGLNPDEIDLSGGARMLWFRALRHSGSHEKITAILERAAQEYPGQRAMLFAALPEFEQRLKRGGGPAPVPTQYVPLLASLVVVCVCFLVYLVVRPPSPPTEALWHSIEGLQDRSFDIAREIGSLKASKDGMATQSQEKAAQIVDLKVVTASLERDLAELRKRKSEGSWTAAQQELTARAEAALATNLAYISAAQGKFEQALRAFEDATSKLKGLSPAPKDQETIDLVNRNVIVVRDHLPRQDSGGTPMPRQDSGGTPNKGTSPDGKPNRQQPAGIAFEPSALASLRIESFEMASEVESHLLLKPGESLGIELEPVGKSSAVDPGKYNIVCNTKSREQFRLASDVEIRAGYRTIVSPQAWIGKVRIDALTLAGFPRLKQAQLIPAGEVDSGMIHGRPRHTENWGVPLTIIQGEYDVLLTPETGMPFVLVKNMRVAPGGEAVVKTNNEIAAIAVRPEATKDFEIERIYVFKSGSDYYVQEATAAGQPMPVYGRDAYDVILKQSRNRTPLNQKLTPLRGELTLVP